MSKCNKLTEIESERWAINAYKKWFKTCLILFVMSVMYFIYQRFISKPNWTITFSFLSILMTTGWALSALAGIYDHTKKYKRLQEEG